MEKSVCFTGYRPEKFSFELLNNNVDCISLKNKIKASLVELINLQYDKFYIGGCCGFDLLAGEILIELREKYNIKIILAMPYISFGRNFTEQWLSLRNVMLESADETIYINRNYTKRCYQDRNEFMVDNSSVIVTYFDGQKGGTLNTLNYGKRNNVKIINVYEENQQLSLNF